MRIGCADEAFIDEMARDLAVHPVSSGDGPACRAHRWRAGGQRYLIAIEDLVIGATALHLGFDVATLNVRHFQVIPGLTVVVL